MPGFAPWCAPPAAKTATYCLPSCRLPRDGNRVHIHSEIGRPEFISIARIERPEFAVRARANENQPAAGRNSSAIGRRRSGLRHAQLVEFFKRAERDLPRNVSGVHIHRNQPRPRRLLAGPSFGSIPEIIANAWLADCPDSRECSRPFHPEPVLLKFARSLVSTKM